MKRIRKSRPSGSAAMIVACVALFMALGGVGYAAATIDGKSIMKRTIAGKKLMKNSVGGTVVKESALGKVPSAGSADSAANAENAATAQSATTAQTAETANSVGPNGVGTAALQDVAVTGAKMGGVTIRTDNVEVAAGDSELLSEACLADERMLSGGAYWGGTPDTDAADLHLVHSYPSSGQWTARGYNGTGGPYQLNLRVVCLTN